jgi:hypothetical protein
METFTSLLALLTGLIVRLAIPLAVTALLIILLRKLDARWQKEAQRPMPMLQKSECWKIKGCSSEQRANCIGAKSPLPCWQAYRLPNGHLNEKCLTCEVFITAPVPTLTTEPGRM